ncbi:NUP214 [Lepeophtheirus salmonis]|uniref:NUP214 n=1 Tax=Lepeophtheirus salmonis TaxID=72036 RepID=A0A7R8CR27_LEPSM|nr:NUP214 [Lepeophtheirus salmonis]CAF2901427.1 NUP214 [Lepeophtheirus salmonis]
MSGVRSPDPKEISELQFSSIGNFQIGDWRDEVNDLSDAPGNAVGVSNKFSRLYLGCKNELVILDSCAIENSTSPEPLGRIPLPSRPKFVSLNADQTTLAVVLQHEQKAKIYLFDTRALENKDFKPFLEIPDWTPPGAAVCDLSWNPVVSSKFCAVYSNGSFALYIVSDGKADMSSLPAAEGIRCVSWSPKGKQLVTEAKTVPCPSINGSLLSVASILWISTYQFAVGYQDSPSNRPSLYIVQSSKTGATSYTNYDDVTYATGEAPNQRFSFKIINEWNLLLCVSTCSMELAVLGGSPDNSIWHQWMFANERAEMPMKDHKDERYPVGMGISFNSKKILAITEASSLPHPMPILYLLSADGLLCCFYIKNLFNGSKNITTGASPFTLEGIRSGLSSINIPKPIGQTMKSTPEVITTLPVTSKPIQPRSLLYLVQKRPQVEQHFFLEHYQLLLPFGGNTEKQAPIPPVTKALVKDTFTKPPPSKNEDPKLQPQTKKNPEVPEIDEFKNKTLDFKIEIGSNEDKLNLKKNTEELDKFCVNVCEITNAQTKEISCLQNLNLEGFEWIEEARSRDVRNNDPKYLKALRGRALDPLSQKKLDNVLSKYMYLDQQLREVNNVLDVEWEDHQNSIRKKNRYNSSQSTPSRDTIYKALLNNHKVLEAQKFQVESLVEKVNEIAMKENIFNKVDSSFNNGINEISDALEKSVFSLRNQSASFKKKDDLSSPIKTFSPKKEAALRQFLALKGSVKVRSTKPTNLSESRFLKLDSNEEMNNSKNLIQALYTESKENINLNNSVEKIKSEKETNKKPSIDNSKANVTTPSFMSNSLASIPKVEPNTTVFSTGTTSTKLFNSTSGTPITTSTSLGISATNTKSSGSQNSTPTTGSSVFKLTSSSTTPVPTTSSVGFTSSNTPLSKPGPFSGGFGGNSSGFAFKTEVPTTEKVDSTPIAASSPFSMGTSHPKVSDQIKSTIVPSHTSTVTTTNSSSSSAVSTSASTSETSTGIFGTKTNSANSLSVFGSSSAPVSTSAGIFGGASVTSTGGGTSTPKLSSTATTIIFGGASTNTTSSESSPIVSSTLTQCTLSKPSSTSTTSVFADKPSSGIFSSPCTVPNTSEKQGVFGTSSNTPIKSTQVYLGATSSSSSETKKDTSGIFSTPSTVSNEPLATTTSVPNVVASSSVLSSSSSASSNIFLLEQILTTTSWLGSTGSGNLFSNSANPSTPCVTGVFGQNSLTGSQSSSIFGGCCYSDPPSSVFNHSTTPSSVSFASSTTGGNAFSINTIKTTASDFTNTSSTFGNTTTTSTSGSIFGGANNSGTPPAFGGGSYLDQTLLLLNRLATLPGLGSAPDPANNSKNIFSTASNFGSTPPPSNLFGGGAGGTSNTFGNSAPSTPQTGMGSSFSGNTPSSQGFGSPKSTVGGFGNAPTFGVNPSFGGTASFGGAPSFGSSSFGGVKLSSTTYFRITISWFIHRLKVLQILFNRPLLLLGGGSSFAPSSGGASFAPSSGGASFAPSSGGSSSFTSWR